MRRDTWDETIRALLAMKDAGLIGLTTPRGPDNFVSQLIDMQNDDGSSFFNVIHMTTICEACEKLPTRSERLMCNHAWVPTYKSKYKQARNAAIARATGSESVTMQEDCGVIVSNLDGCVFDPDVIKRVFDLKNPDTTFKDHNYVPPRIYIFSDPNAGGASNTTVQSGFWAPPRSVESGGGHDRFVYLGMDVQNTSSPSEKEQLLLNHIDTIRGISEYSKVPIICIIERNTADAAIAGQTAVEKLSSVVVLHEVRGGHKENVPGVWLDEKKKGDYVRTMYTLMDSGQICWSSKLFTNSVRYASMRRGSNKVSVKSNIEIVVNDTMLEMIRLKTDKNKISGKANGFQDDQAITFMMGPKWSREVENLSSSTYESYRKLRWVEKGYRRY